LRILSELKRRFAGILSKKKRGIGLIRETLLPEKPILRSKTADFSNNLRLYTADYWLFT